MRYWYSNAIVDHVGNPELQLNVLQWMVDNSECLPSGSWLVFFISGPQIQVVIPFLQFAIFMCFLPVVMQPVQTRTSQLNWRKRMGWLVVYWLKEPNWQANCWNILSLSWTGSAQTFTSTHSLWDCDLLVLQGNPGLHRKTCCIQPAVQAEQPWHCWGAGHYLQYCPPKLRCVVRANQVLWSPAVLDLEFDGMV